MQVLETTRLLLRQFTLEDVNDLAALYANPAVTPWFPEGSRTPEHAKARIEKCLEEYAKGQPSFWATIHKADHRFIGRCGVSLKTLEGRLEAEIGYMLAKPYWNQGLGTEVARAIKDWAFRHLTVEHVIAIIDPQNIASQRVAEKSGMTFDRDAEFEGSRCRIYLAKRPE